MCSTSYFIKLPTIVLKSVSKCYKPTVNFGSGYTLLEKFGGFPCICLMTLLPALCDVKFRQIEGNGRNFPQRELSNSAIS